MSGYLQRGVAAGLAIKESWAADDRAAEDKAFYKDMADGDSEWNEMQKSKQEAAGSDQIADNAPTQQGDLEPADTSMKQPQVNAIPDVNDPNVDPTGNNLQTESVNKGQYIRDSVEEDVVQNEASTGMKQEGTSTEVATAPEAEGATTEEKLPPPELRLAQSMLTNPKWGDPEYLNFMADRARDHAGKTGRKDHYDMWQNYSEMGFKARKSGVTDSLRYFLLGDAKAGAAALRRGGIKVTGDPVPVEGKKDTWIMCLNGKSQEVDIGRMVKAADPTNFAKEYVKNQGSSKGALDRSKIALNEKKGEATDSLTKKRDAETAKIKAAKKEKEKSKNYTDDIKTAIWKTEASPDLLKAYEDHVSGKKEMTQTQITKMIADIRNADPSKSFKEAQADVEKILKMGADIYGKQGKGSIKEAAPEAAPEGAPESTSKVRDYDPATGKFK